MKKKLLYVTLLLVFAFSFMTTFTAVNVDAGVTEEPYVNDTFDAGFDGETWQKNGEAGIDFAGSEGGLRYNDPSGAEEVMITSDPLTEGNVKSYRIQFDLEYLSDNWSDMFIFAFNKTDISKGLDWGTGGYLLSRNTSIQVNNANDTVHGPSAAVPGTATGYAEMTPSIPSISFVPVTYVFEYEVSTQTVTMYYDNAGESADLTTERNSYTFGNLDESEDYHFAIVALGNGLFNLNNLSITQTMDDDTEVVYVDEAFDTYELPEEIQLIDEDKFSYGPKQELEFTGSEASSYITKDSFEMDDMMNRQLNVNYAIEANQMTVDKKSGFVYGLNDANANYDSTGASFIYFVDRDVDGTITTHIGSMYEGTVISEIDLGARLVDFGRVDVELLIKQIGFVDVTLNDGTTYTLETGATIGHFGFANEIGNHVLIDDLESVQFNYHDQSDTENLYNNFNTGYLNADHWEIDNQPMLIPGSEQLIVPSAQDVLLADGKLVFDVAGESSAFYTVPDFSNFEMRFTVSDYGIPMTPTDEDGMIDGVEIPNTHYVAVGLGYEETSQNFWDVATAIFQSRDGGSVVYGLNMNDSTIYPRDNRYVMNSEENAGIEWDFKVVAENGTVKLWMKQASDPISMFEEDPIVTYENVDHVGRIAISSSALGSFKVDDLSIVRTSENIKWPEIADEYDPETLVAPEITIDQSLPVEFELNQEEQVDITEYFSAEDNVDGIIEINEDMIDDDGFTLEEEGTYEVTATVTDSDGNQSEATVELIVQETDEGASGLVIGLLTGSLSIVVGIAATSLYFIRFRK